MFELTKFNAPIFKKSFADNLFDDFFSFPTIKYNSNSFKLDIKEDEKNYFIEADLPGIKKEEIAINYENDNLIIGVERKEEKEKNEDNFIHKERSYSAMKRSIHLPEIEAKDIKAKLEDGVLKLDIKKTKQTQISHKIEIE